MIVASDLNLPAFVTTAGRVAPGDAEAAAALKLLDDASELAQGAEMRGPADIRDAAATPNITGSASGHSGLINAHVILKATKT